MYKNKLLIYGGNGWIGKQFCNYISQIDSIELLYSKCRINMENKVSFIDELDRLKPTHAICFLGRTNGKIGNKIYSTIDYLENDDKLTENINDNLYAPIILALLCQQKNIHFTYIGTGCIYNGNNIYETDIPNFQESKYSLVKSFTDNIVDTINCLNLRIRMPITSVPSERNFITKIVNYKIIHSQVNSVTILDDFIPIFVKMILNNMTGTFNCVNPNPIDHNTMLKMYKMYVNSNHEWENVDKQYLIKNGLIKAGRSNNTLNCNKILSYFDIPDTSQSLINVLKTYKNNL